MQGSGTERRSSEVDRILASGKHALLDIEVMGPSSIRKSWKGRSSD